MIPAWGSGVGHDFPQWALGGFQSFERIKCILEMKARMTILILLSQEYKRARGRDDADHENVLLENLCPCPSPEERGWRSGRSRAALCGLGTQSSGAWSLHSCLLFYGTQALCITRFTSRSNIDGEDEEQARKDGALVPGHRVNRRRGKFGSTPSWEFLLLGSTSDA